MPPGGDTATGGRTVELTRPSTTTLESLAREQHKHAVWLCREYVALTFQDCEDLVADALSRVNGDLPGTLPAARAYLSTMLRRDAIDLLRHRHGRRPSEKHLHQTVALEALGDAHEIAGHETVDAELVERADRAVGQAAVRRVLAALPEQERETLRMRYLDGLGPAAICRGLGLSRTQYERRLTDGIRGALETLVAEAPLPTCKPVRSAIAAGPARLGVHDAARRDAHLEECLSCRAFERRARGLLAGLPAGPALGWWAQLRLRGEDWLHRAAEAVSGSPGDATVAAGGAGTGAAGGLSAGGLLASGAAVKVAAVCSSAAVAVVCVAQIGPPPERPARKAPAAQASKPAPRRAQTEPARVVAMMPTPAAPVASGSERTRATAAARSSKSSTESRAARSARRRAAEFDPEGAAAGSAAPAGNATATASSGSGSSGSGSSAPPTSTPSAGRPRPASNTSASEFAP